MHIALRLDDHNLLVGFLTRTAALGLVGAC